jgi:vancomycin resistance protein VanK
VHWAILRDLLAEGVAHYDLRGVKSSLDPDRPGFGLVRFKLGTGGDAVELVGDWDLPVRPAAYRAVLAALRLRPAVAAGLGRLRRAVRR